MSCSDHGDKPHTHAHSGSSRFSLELTSHLPFSVSAGAIGLVLAGMICVLAAPDEEIARQTAHLHTTERVQDHPAEEAHDHDHPAEEGHDHDHPAEKGQDNDHPADEGHDHEHTGSLAEAFFHLFHPTHMFFSAAATTAMFWRYERKSLKAIIVGLVGAIVVCGISDIGMPYGSQFALEYLGGLEPLRPLELHVCVIEHPGLVFPFAIVGVAVGLAAARGVERSTLFSHSLHVFTSTMASIFYLIGPFGRTEWIPSLGLVFFLVILAVLIPCCISDIIFPLAMARPARQQMEACGHHSH